MITNYRCILYILSLTSFATSKQSKSINPLNINQTMINLNSHIQAQRHEEASQLGTSFLINLIAGPYLHTLTAAHQDIIANVLDITTVDLYARANGGETMLHAAVRRSDVHLVQLLLFTNATHVNAQSDDGLFTALHLAVDYANYEILYHLIQNKNVDGTVQDIHGRTPIHSAIIRSDLKSIKLLIEKYPETLYMQDINMDTPYTLANTPPIMLPILELLSSSTESIVSTTRSSIVQYRSTNDRLPANGKWKSTSIPNQNLRCDIDILNMNSTEYTDDTIHDIFLNQYYSRSKPVIIRGIIEHWKGREFYRRGNLLRSNKFTKSTFRTSNVPYSKNKTNTKKRTLSSYVKKCMRGKKKGCIQNEILFDRIVLKKDEDWTSQSTNGIPRLASICSTSYPKPSSVRKPQLIISTTKGGAPFHDHQHALNALFYGSKEWMLVSPNFAHVASSLSKTKNEPLIKWNETRKKLRKHGILAECTQLAGDLLYVPRMWMHATKTIVRGFFLIIN